jgi:hypothetical protein
MMTGPAEVEGQRNLINQQIASIFLESMSDTTSEIMDLTEIKTYLKITLNFLRYWPIFTCQYGGGTISCRAPTISTTR